MPIKIEKLTPDQEVKLIEWRERYLAMGLSCEPANRVLAEDAINRAYKSIGKDPVPILWVGSPLSANILLFMLEKYVHDIEDNLRDNLWANLGANLRANLRANLGANLRANLGANLGANLWANLWANLGDNLWANLRANLRANLWANLRANLGANLEANLRANLRDNLRTYEIPFVDTYWCGQTDLYWIACYRFCGEVLGIAYSPESSKKLKIMEDIGKSCNFFYPRDGVCIVCDRPESISKKGIRLHNDAGPAIRFRDGYEIYCWNGINVPNEWIADRSFLNPEKIDTIGNVELRRCATEIFGEKRYIEEGGAEKIHEDDFGILYRKDIPGDEPLVMVHVENGTIENGIRRKFFLQVHPELRPLLFDGELGEPQSMTALNAVASTYGMRGDEYCKLRQRT